MTQGVHPFDIDYISQLARIKLSHEEKEHFYSQLDNVLTYFEKLQVVDTSQVKPLANMSASYNVCQDDEPSVPFSPEVALANAPTKKDNQIHVPTVVE